MSLRLRKHLYWCESNGRVVFLDLAADRYFSVPHASNEAFLRLVRSELCEEDRDHLRPLVARGLLTEDPASQNLDPAHVIDPPTCDLLGEVRRRAPVLETLKILFRERQVAALLRARPFVQVLEATVADPIDDQPLSTEAARWLNVIASAAAEASLITRAHDRCLIRALAVQSRCRRLGLKTRLVFGVRGHPFAAHCWVQFERAVVVGDFEQARLYTPILVI